MANNDDIVPYACNSSFTANIVKGSSSVKVRYSFCYQKLTCKQSTKKEVFKNDNVKIELITETKYPTIDAEFLTSVPDKQTIEILHQQLRVSSLQYPLVNILIHSDAVTFLSPSNVQYMAKQLEITEEITKSHVRISGIISTGMSRGILNAILKKKKPSTLTKVFSNRMEAMQFFDSM